MLKGNVYCDRKFVAGSIDPHMYGSFLEHMGRVIYTGIYEPAHVLSDDEGYRTDVMEAVKRMGVTAVRYPGGNFVSAYHWEDGVGSKEQRPRKLDLAWRSIETNEFGTDEFVHWAKKAGVEPIFTVNLGSRGMEEAVQYLEYCNFPGGTAYSDLRKSHGVQEPYGIRLWCLGNEMDGEWQIGHKTAYEYGRLAAETGKAMKLIDPDIELIVCGSSLSSMDTCPQWDMEVLELTYDVVDYLALHQYYGGQERGTKAFLAQTLDFEQYIRTLRAVAQVVKQKKRSKKDIKFSVDEWGVWAVPGNSVNAQIDRQPWQIAPAISEQIYTLEDALLFAGMQMAMLRNADVIRIACQSLLTNISACIMTQENGDMWLQTIYYPFFYLSNYARGVVLQDVCQSDCYECEDFPEVPYLDVLTVWNQEQHYIAIFAINKSEDEKLDADVTLQCFERLWIRTSVELTAEDKKMDNSVDHQAVVPRETANAAIADGHVRICLKPMSFNMILVDLAE